MSELRVGMIGCGTVGGGVLDRLTRRGDELARQAGKRLRVTHIAVRDPQRRREKIEQFLPEGVEWTADVGRITAGPDIDLVVEVAGGTVGPRDWMVDALRNGRDVVTANKAALAFHGAEIFGEASRRGRRVYYEASIAGAIPIVEMLQNALVANQLTSLAGILNGTCNYILTRMEQEGLEYGAALTLAQEKGFAEADPGLDVEGGDTTHKLALLVGILSGAHIPVEEIYTEGIDRIAVEDVEFAKRFKYRIKMLAIGKRHEGGAWELRVHPTLIPDTEILAQVHNEFNAIDLRGDAVGPMLISGKGAGSLPTASSVVADMVRAARQDGATVIAGTIPAPALVPIEQVQLRHYVRLTVLDVPGVLGKITSLFGSRGISIASIHQPESRTGQPVPVVLVTHEAGDQVVNEALGDLEQAGLLHSPPTRIRIEDVG